jgi:thymidylate synthase
MPYDERLEGIANHGGTRSDFPQRALKHFVAHLHAQELSVADATSQVCAAMSASFKPIIPKRMKTPDEQIAELIRTNWSHCEGSASKLLRFLRDDANVACEQSRFSGIWREIKEERSSTKGEMHA